MGKSFMALVLFEISTDTTTLYEENFVEIKADTLKEAEKLANTYGNNNIHEYKNEDNQTVQNNFIQVIDVSEVLYEEAENNVRELYSRHFEDLDSYKKIEKLLK